MTTPLQSSPDNKPVKVFLTGATGVMGSAGLRYLTAEPGKYDVTILARPSKKNAKKLREYIEKGVAVVWGSLENYKDVARGVRRADVILHVGGAVSPGADWHPKAAIRTNVTAMKNIVKAVKEQSAKHTDLNEPKVVYIGSVSQYSSRAIPEHWGGVGDPLIPALYDAYAYSKIEAERILAESGIKKWVSLRQTGILHPGLLMNAGDPISFHVPIRGVLEWVTAEDSGRLLEKVCHRDVPDDFWCDFYNIGGGEGFRMTNYEFESRLLKAIGCPPPEKIFDPSWFATRNFHGMWYYDSDRLENYLHFRSGESVDDYFKRMVAGLPFYFKLTPLAPAGLIKGVMKKVAMTERLGTLWWIKNNVEERIKASFGSREAWEKIGDWNSLDLSIPDKSQSSDNSKDYVMTTKSYHHHPRFHKDDYSGEVKFDNITLLSPYEGDYHAPLNWRCAKGHDFEASMMLVERGGHRCPQCIREAALLE